MPVGPGHHVGERTPVREAAPIPPAPTAGRWPPFTTTMLAPRALQFLGRLHHGVDRRQVAPGPGR